MLSLFCLFVIGAIFDSKVNANEIDDFLKAHTLLGEELESFERNENESFSKNRMKERDIDFEKLEEQYKSYVEAGIFSEEITLELYIQLTTTPPPSDPVTPEFRSVAGNPKAGDILITNGTSLGGLTGHAGIFLGDLGNGGILSIQGPGKNPEVIGIMTWMQRYSGADKWTKIYRPASKYKPETAAKWAINNYQGKKYSYKVNTKLFEKDPTYCSKIVYQSYWYSSAAVQLGGMYEPLIASPYDLPNYFDTKPTHIATWK